MLIFFYRSNLLYPSPFLKINRLKDMFGSLSEPYNKEHWYEYMHTSFFAVRRLALIMILVYLPNYPFA